MSVISPAAAHAAILQDVVIPAGLAGIAAGRDHLLTAEMAAALGRSPKTVRKVLCEQGEVYGIRPVKIGGRLLWPVREVARVLATGGAA